MAREKQRSQRFVTSLDMDKRLNVVKKKLMITKSVLCRMAVDKFLKENE